MSSNWYSACLKVSLFKESDRILEKGTQPNEGHL